MRHIVQEFPGVLALDDVQFDLKEGEVHVLLGENGAGKSTLVKILSGANLPSRGEIRLDGAEIRIGSPRRAQELGIAIIYQELNLIPSLNAAENIFLGREPGRLRGLIDQRKMIREAQEILDGLHAGIDARRRVKELSVAQQQMVEVARALSLKARILIMDEPTSALTEQEIAELFALIRRLLKTGVSVIYISHRLEELYEIGDRVTVLRDGKYITTCDIADTSRSELIRLMVDRDLQEHYPKVRIKPGEEVLRVEKLTRKGVLQDISFSLRRGEVVGIAGLLGSGRTELARALFGADPVDSGQLYIESKPVRIDSPRAAIRQGIGFLTEDRKTQGLVLGLSVKENICLPNLDSFSRMGWVSVEREKAAAQEYVGKLRIRTPGLDQKAKFLSGGNQQKVVMSKWLCSQSHILLFDEPTRGIDVGAKVEIYQLMNQLTASGAAILMISSELTEILGMSDRILVMCHGRIAAEFAAADATQEKILHYALGEH
jgi:ribose transport system ATP-binding protein